jgi:dTDP-4-amino-4,6-dideoxygalactose transaminase
MSDQIGVGTFEVTPRMRALVNEVLDSGRISYGDKSRAFEERFAQLHGADYAVLSNSGTSSLHVALQAMKEIGGWSDGDEVIVPAVTFVASVNVILHNGLVPVLVDVDPRYYEIDCNLIEQAITPRTRAIMPVHLFGLPCDMTTIMDIAERHGLKVLADSCECMFVTHQGKPTGAWGDIVCYSTYVAHLLTTGIGGLSLTNDPRYAAKMRSLVNHGRDGIYLSIDDDRGLTNGALKEVIARRFNFESIGHSFRITELEAALGLAQLDDWYAMIFARQTNAKYITHLLSRYIEHLQRPLARPLTDHAFMMYPLVLRKEDKRALTELLEKRGIETRAMLPLINQPCYAGLWNADDYPVAQWIERSGFYIGCHQGLTINDLDRIVSAFAEYFEPTPVLDYGLSGEMPVVEVHHDFA